MITYDQLHTENDRITQLSKILDRLIDNRELLDMDATCELFYQYMNSVDKHLDAVDRTYSPLLSSTDTEDNNIAKNFMSGSQEIRRIMKSYSKSWCSKQKDSIRIANHEKFINETREIFEMVLNRIIHETEILYPKIRRLSGNTKMAA